VNVTLNYGCDGLEVALPDDADVTVIHKPSMPQVGQAANAVLNALHNPVGAPPLSELAGSAASACIAICDITRPVPNGLFLRPVIEMLLAGGIPVDRITVLVATGLHRPNQGDELAELVGDPGVLENVRVENHFAATMKTTSWWASPPPGVRSSAWIGDSSRQISGLRPVLLNPISWPVTRAGVK